MGIDALNLRAYVIIRARTLALRVGTLKGCSKQTHIITYLCKPVTLDSDGNGKHQEKEDGEYEERTYKKGRRSRRRMRMRTRTRRRMILVEV